MSIQPKFIEITHSNIEEYIGLGIVAFHWAGGGACGEPCGVIFVTREGRAFHTNYGSTEHCLVDGDLTRLFPSLAWVDVYIIDVMCPKGWKSCYLGLGNYLVVHETIWKEFQDAAKAEQTRRSESGEGGILYNFWVEVVLAVLEGKQFSGVAKELCCSVCDK